MVITSIYSSSYFSMGISQFPVTGNSLRTTRRELKIPQIQGTPPRSKRSKSLPQRTGSLDPKKSLCPTDLKTMYVCIYIYTYTLSIELWIIIWISIYRCIYIYNYVYIYMYRIMYIYNYVYIYISLCIPYTPCIVVYSATKLGDFCWANVGIHIPAPWSIWE